MLSSTSPDELGATWLCSSTDIYIFTRCHESIKSLPYTPNHSHFPACLAARSFPFPIPAGLPLAKLQPISHLPDFYAVDGESFRNVVQTPSMMCKPTPFLSPLESVAPCAIFDFLDKDAPDFGQPYSVWSHRFKSGQCFL